MTDGEQLTLQADPNGSSPFGPSNLLAILIPSLSVSYLHPAHGDPQKQRENYHTQHSLPDCAGEHPFVSKTYGDTALWRTDPQQTVAAMAFSVQHPIVNFADWPGMPARQLV